MSRSSTSILQSSQSRVTGTGQDLKAVLVGLAVLEAQRIDTDINKDTDMYINIYG